MKKIVLTTLINLSLFGFEYNLKPEKIVDDVYCFFGKVEPINIQNGGNMVNSCYIDMGKYYILIDSGPTYNYAKDAHSKMKKIADKEIKYVINTHHHDDHHLGNIYYSKLGAKIVGSKDLKKHFKNVSTLRMEKLTSKEIFENTKLKFADIEIADKFNLDGLEITNFKGHTDNDLIVFNPNKKILFVGDLIFDERILKLEPDSNLNGWIEAIEAIEKINFKYLITGHGKRIDREAIKSTKEYLIDLRSEVKKALENGIDLSEVVNFVKLDKYKNLKLFEDLNGFNVYSAYQLLEWDE